VGEDADRPLRRCSTRNFEQRIVDLLAAGGCWGWLPGGVFVLALELAAEGGAVFQGIGTQGEAAASTIPQLRTPASGPRTYDDRGPFEFRHTRTKPALDTSATRKAVPGPEVMDEPWTCRRRAPRRLCGLQARSRRLRAMREDPPAGARTHEPFHSRF
jgi:hypothetical protein